MQDKAPSTGQPDRGIDPAVTRPKKGEFFSLGVQLTGGKGHGVVFENEDRLLTPPRLIIRPVGGGFPPLREKPQLRYNPKANMPRDLEGGLSGYWLVSERLKQIFESVDPDGFAFVACDFTLPDGSQGPQHHLCDVVRTLDALDEEASEFRTKYATDHNTGEEVKIYSFAGGAKVTFCKDVIGNAHIFRMAEKPSAIICDSALYDACKAFGMNKKGGLRGLSFDDAAEL